MADPENRRRETARSRLGRMTGEGGEGDAAKEAAKARALAAAMTEPELRAMRAAAYGPALGPDRPADPLPRATVLCPDAPAATAVPGSIGLLLKPPMDYAGPDAPPGELWLVELAAGHTLAGLREAAGGGDTLRLEIRFRPPWPAAGKAPEDGAA